MKIVIMITKNNCVINIIVIVIHTEIVISNVYDAGHSAIKPDTNTGI